MASNKQTMIIIIIILVILATTTKMANCEPTSDLCEFPAIFNFGDSNSDTGGLSAAFHQLGPPFGETFFHAPAGRNCDGRLVIDFYAQSLGLPYLSAYLDSVGSNFTYGANFATAGATIKSTPGGISPFPLLVQQFQFQGFHQRSQIFYQKGGVYEDLLPKEEYFRKALYTLDIGQNDLTAGFFANMSTDQVKAYIPDLLDHFASVIQFLYGEGGRNFWIHNTGPIGCLPFVLNTLLIKASDVDAIGCASPFNEVANFFNHKLKDVVANLRKEFPTAAFTYVDVYSVKYDLISNGTKYGFEQPLRACCGHGGKYNFNKDGHCGGYIHEGGKQVFVGSCKDPSRAIIWDGVHYTEAANHWIFNQIVNGSYSDPPIPLGMACL